MIGILSDTAADIPWHNDLWNQFNETVAQARVPHAMLLLGAGGNGKTLLAHRFAAKLLCDAENESAQPCGHCKSCSQIKSGTNPGLRIFEPEDVGKQLKVDVIRELTAQSTLAVEKGRFCIFIIRSAGTMNQAAANALLKTLEEPVPGLVLILLAEFRTQLPATILSRCQQSTLATPPFSASLPWLRAQDASLDAETALRVAQGAPLTALDSAADQSMTQTLFNAFIDLSNGKQSAHQLAESWVKASDLNRSLNLLLGWVEDLIRLGTDPSDQAAHAINIDGDLKTLAKRIDLTAMFLFRDGLLQAKKQHRHNLNAQLVLDELFIQWTNISLQ